MDLIDIISITSGVGGVFLGGCSLYFQFQDRPNIRIREFHPVLFATKNDDATVWSHKIEYMRLEVENIGSRMAYDLTAIVVFPGLDALPMFPIDDGAFQRDQRIFDLKPKERIELWGTWKEGSPDYFGDGHLSLSQFLNSGVPAVAKLQFADKEITAELKKQEVEKFFQKQQASTYG